MTGPTHWIGRRMACNLCGDSLWQGRLIHHWAYVHGMFEMQANERRQEFADLLSAGR